MSGGRATAVLIIFKIYKKADVAGVRRQQPEGPSETIPRAECLIFTFTQITHTSKLIFARSTYRSVDHI